MNPELMQLELLKAAKLQAAAITLVRLLLRMCDEVTVQILQPTIGSATVFALVWLVPRMRLQKVLLQHVVAAETFTTLLTLGII